LGAVSITLSAGVTTASGRIGFPSFVDLSAGITSPSGLLTFAPFLYVVDSGNNRIEAWTWEGAFLFNIGPAITGLTGDLNSPYGVTTDGEYLYFTDSGNARVVKTDLYGNFVTTWGTVGSGLGQFNNPMGITTSETDPHVWVVDSDNNRFQVFAKDGTLVFYLGIEPDGTPLNHPTDCWEDDVYFYLYDAGNGRTVFYPLAFGETGFSFSFPALSMNWTVDTTAVSFDLILERPLIGLKNWVITQGIGAQFNFAMPSLGMNFQVNEGSLCEFALSMPPLDFNFQGAVGNTVKFDIPFPALGFSFPVTVGDVVQFSLSMPPLGMIFYGASNHVPASYKAVVMNLALNALTEYPDYDFNSFFLFNGQVYGINDSGIFPLDGTDDNGTPIVVTAKSGDIDSDAGTEYIPAMAKRPNEAFLLYDAIGNPTLSVWGDKDGEYDYPVVSERVPLGKGFESRYYHWKLSGSSINLGSVRMLFDMITHRRR
jgi:hypothetical protein